ncbi:MAG: hypothetical protein E6801_29550, partial [Pseudomonas aeruginosa]|nr:hypothetical protein [Pseudomonas aeruginosa]
MSAKMDEQALLALLRELAIDSQRVEHPAIASIEEYYAQGIELPDQGIKNLFLRNRKGNRQIESLKRMFRCFIDTRLF